MFHLMLPVGKLCAFSSIRVNIQKTPILGLSLDFQTVCQQTISPFGYPLVSSVHTVKN